MTAPRRSPRPALRSTSWAALALVAAMLVVPAGAPLCASELGECAAEAAPMACPMADAMGAMPAMPDMPDMDCCVAGEAPRDPAPAAPGKSDGERQVQPRSLLALAPLAAVVPASALLLPEPAPARAADLAAPAVPLYTLLSSLLS